MQLKYCVLVLHGTVNKGTQYPDFVICFTVQRIRRLKQKTK